MAQYIFITFVKYRNDCKFLDRQVFANSVDPGKEQSD